MQVSQVETANTHAVIGGGAARGFGMSDSAEFYTVLSSTLYRDKKRAVARETICNAWDAHIMSGKTHLPIEITLTKDELVIRDFGPGISDEFIIPIYCIYGGTTKLMSLEATGGFGLGSKAPFAYSDHFSVTSHHEGIKTVYAISRGGLETEGKPSCTPMVSVPTEETGIVVTIPIRSKEDMWEFEEHIKAVILQGGIKATLNNKVLDTLDYTEARKSGFMITSIANTGLNESRVYVLYGTVLYPVTSTDKEVSAAARKVSNLLPKTMMAILTAPPNSIGVVPSREALSYTDSTIATVKGLADRLTGRIKHLIPQATKQLLTEKLHEKDGMRYDLDWFEARHDTDSIIRMKDGASTPLGAARAVANVTYFKLRCDEYIAQEVGALAAKMYPMGRRSLRRAFLGGFKNRNHPRFFKKEAMRHSTRLFRRAGAQVGVLDKFYMYCGHRHGLKAGKYSEVTSHEAVENLLVIAQSRIEAKLYIEDHLKETARDHHKELAFMCVSIPRNKAKLRAKMIAAAEKYGIETHEITVAAPKREKIVKVKGKYLDLKYFDLNKGFTGALSLEDPKFYVRFETTITEIRNGFSWLQNVQEYLTEEFGNSIAVIRGAAQLREIQKTGAKDAIAELAKVVKKAGKTRDGQYAALLQDNKFVDFETAFYGAGREARDLVSKCPLAFFEFLPARVTSKQKVMKTATLIKMLSGYLYANNMPSDYPITQGDLRTIKIAAGKTFHSDMLPLKEFDYRFRDIDLIQDYRISPENTEKHKTVVKLIRCVKRTGPMPKEENV